MPVPIYEQILLPLLKFSADKKEHSSKDPIDQLARYFDPRMKRKSKYCHGSTVFYNRVGWAQTYLKQAGLLTSTKRD